MFSRSEESLGSQPYRREGRNNPYAAGPVAAARSPAPSDVTHTTDPLDITYGSFKLLSPWFPQINPDDPRAKTFSGWKSRRRVVLWTAFSITSLVFILNAVLSALSWTQLSNDTPDEYLRNLYTGECKTVKDASIAAHLLINILSTLMLSASNLCMQLIAAPSRKDIDKAHKRGIWLDIGVPSLRNLFYIPWTRGLLWGVLVFSSLPIHFLYNSAVLTTSTMNQYAQLVVTEDFLSRPFSNETITGYGPIRRGSYPWERTYAHAEFSGVINIMTTDYQNVPENFTSLSVFEGLRRYDTPFKWRPNLIAVADDDSVSLLLPETCANNSSCPATSSNKGNASLLDWRVYTPDSLWWKTLCDYTFDGIAGTKCSHLDEWTEEDINAWTLGHDFKIKRFVINPNPVTQGHLSQQKCHLQCAPVILLVVTIFNGIKCLCMLWVIWSSQSATICTLGDAIASFLERPDEVTKESGVASRASIIRSGKFDPSRKGQRLPATFQPKPTRWTKASSKRRWFWSILGFVIVIVFATICTVQGFVIFRTYGTDMSTKGLLSLGFGAPNWSELISWHQPTEGLRGLLANIVIANIWQILVSLLYFAFNAILSCQLLAREWVNFGQGRKTLRVSHPQGIQRESFFISMPLKYGIPIMAVFAIEHWLISQSAFVIRILLFDFDGTPLPGFTMAGFSIIPCITALTLGFLCFVGYMSNSIFRKYDPVYGLPFASTCSLAIASNCHRPAADKHAYLLPVQWGIYEQDDGVTGAKCAFTTSRKLQAPESGDMLWTLPAVSVEKRTLKGMYDKLRARF